MAAVFHFYDSGEEDDDDDDEYVTGTYHAPTNLTTTGGRASNKHSTSRGTTHSSKIMEMK